MVWKIFKKLGKEMKNDVKVNAPEPFISTPVCRVPDDGVDMKALEDASEHLFNMFSVDITDMKKSDSMDDVDWAFQDADVCIPPAPKQAKVPLSPSPYHDSPLQILSPPCPIATPAVPTTPSLCIDDFEIKKVLGSGAFGCVYAARNRDTDEKHAVKVLRKKELGREWLATSEQQVLKVLSESSGSAFFLELQASFHDSMNFYYVTPILVGGSLAQEFKKCGERFPAARVKYYMAELVYGVEFLHSQRIMHRDLKLENILINESGHLVIGDFGLAKILGGDEDDTSMDGMDANPEDDSRPRGDYTMQFCGTPGYMAPEIYANKGYSYPSDVWSLGVMMFLMIYGKLPFEGDDRAVMLATQYQRVIFPNSPEIPHSTLEVLVSLLQKSPARRPNLHRLKTYGYFVTVVWDAIAKRKYKLEWVTAAAEEAKNNITEDDEKDDDDDEVDELYISTGYPYGVVADPYPDFTYTAPVKEKPIEAPPPSRFNAWKIFNRFTRRKAAKSETACPPVVSTNPKAPVKPEASEKPKASVNPKAPIASTAFRHIHNTAKRYFSPRKPMTPNPVPQASVCNTQDSLCPPSYGGTTACGSPSPTFTKDASKISASSFGNSMRTEFANWTHAAKVKTGWTKVIKVRQNSERRQLDLLA